MDLRAAQSLAVDLMVKHGLAAKGWIFSWDHARTRYGYASYRRKLISLSKPLTRVNEEPQVRDTILHEIAHALCGPGTGHGRLWKVMAHSIGARPETCGAGVGVKGRYRGTCADCGKDMYRFKRPRNRFLEKGYHVECRRRGKTGRLSWFDTRTNMHLGVVKAYTPEPPREIQPVPESIAAKQVAPATNTGTPTQSQINELWERLNRLEGK